MRPPTHPIGQPTHPIPQTIHPKRQPTHRIDETIAGRAEKLVALLNTKDAAVAGAEFYNSLEAPALDKYPLLALYQEFLHANGAAAALMSGSGSTTFAIARSEADARRLEDQLLARFGPCWTTVVPV